MTSIQSKLQQQVIYTGADIGASNVDRARQAIADLNPHIIVDSHPARVSESNVVDLVSGYDIVADCTDNAAARCTIADACFHGPRASGDYRER